MANPKKQQRRSAKRSAKDKRRHEAMLINEPCPDGLLCADRNCLYLHVDDLVYAALLKCDKVRSAGGGADDEDSCATLMRKKHGTGVRIFLCPGDQHRLDGDDMIIVSESRAATIRDYVCPGCDRLFCLSCVPTFVPCESDKCEMVPRCYDCTSGRTFPELCGKNGLPPHAARCEEEAKMINMKAPLIRCMARGCDSKNAGLCVCCTDWHTPGQDGLYRCARCPTAAVCLSCKDDDGGSHGLNACDRCREEICAQCDPEFDRSRNICARCAKARQLVSRIGIEYLTDDGVADNETSEDVGCQKCTRALTSTCSTIIPCKGCASRVCMSCDPIRSRGRMTLGVGYCSSCCEEVVPRLIRQLDDGGYLRVMADAYTSMACGYCTNIISTPNGTESKRCKLCKAVRYCDRACQKLDWMKHRDHCEDMGKARRERNARWNDKKAAEGGTCSIS